MAELHFNCYRLAGVSSPVRVGIGDPVPATEADRLGALPLHPAEAGAFIVATRLDVELKETGFGRDTPKRMAKSPRLDHWVETNDFFTRLAWALKSEPATLAEWWGERRCRRLWNGVEPDGLGRLAGSKEPPAPAGG